MLNPTTIQKLNFNIASEHVDAFLELGVDNIGEYWTKENFLMNLKDKWDLSLFSKTEDKFSGYLIASNKLGKAHIHHLIVGKDFRNNKIGGNLVRELEKNIINDYSAITLKVHESNKNAIRFYNDLNFRKISEIGEYVIMEKRLKYI